jgi:tRNA 2-thiouridine synthesizing protein A
VSDIASTESSPAATVDLDCRGLNCPLPILRTKKAITPMASGEILKMVATDPGSVADVAAFSRRTGHQIVDQSEGDGEFVFYLRRA